jgi:DNA/RNA endonuclease YhcR with UshA esterase domain
MKLCLALLFCCILPFVNAFGQSIIAAKNASKHIGETVTVIEKIFAGSKPGADARIVLDAGGYQPNQLLTVIIPSTSRKKFSRKPEADYLGKDVAITGKVKLFQGRPTIVVSDPRYLAPVMVDNFEIREFPAQRQ